VIIGAFSDPESGYVPEYEFPGVAYGTLWVRGPGWYPVRQFRSGDLAVGFWSRIWRCFFGGFGLGMESLGIRLAPS